MEKFFLFSYFGILVVVFNLCESEMLHKENREKRQLYYRDITAKPRSFRSRAEEKDETDRTGHLPLESHYPFDENYEGELVGFVPHFPEGGSASYDNKHHETSKPSSFSVPSYDEQHETSHYFPKPEYEAPIYKPKPTYEEPHYEPKPIHEEPHYKPTKPIYEESHYKPKPIHEEPHYKPKPIYEESHYQPKPIHEESHYKPNPIHEEPHYKPKPIHEESHYKPKPIHVEPHYASKPVYEEPSYKPTQSYDVPSYNDGKNRPHKNKNSTPGIAGKDYPIYREVPYTSFSCADVPHRPGMYANPEAGCQAYHVCHDDRHGPQGASFLCTNGTLFNQETFSCDWWYNVDCNQARSYYGLNSDPHHNPYSQKPYFDEPSQYSDDVIVHSEGYKPSFRESKPKEQYKRPINPINSPSEIKNKLVLKPKGPPVQQPPQPSKYKSSEEKVSKGSMPETKKSHFNIESNHGSFFSPFSFENEEQAPAFITKKENQIVHELYSEPFKRQMVIQTKISQKIPTDEAKLNHNLLSKSSKSQLVKTSLLESTKREPQISTIGFPESKDIYSRVVANQKRTIDSQFTKPQIRESLQKDSSITSLKEDMRFEHSDFKDLNFKWGEKI